MAQTWEYQVGQFGSALRAAKTEEIEEFLNEVSLEGWELSHTASMSNGNKLLMIMRRKTKARARRRETTWP